MSDDTIHRAVMKALADNPRVRADEISVEVRDGDVVLRGTVGSVVQQAEAAKAPRGIPGVGNIDDELKIHPMGIDGRADADTEAAVLDALAADGLLAGSEVDVESRDGTVTLRGGVELASQRDGVERVALAVPGVTHVVNRLDVWHEVSAPDPLGS